MSGPLPPVEYDALVDMVARLATALGQMAANLGQMAASLDEAADVLGKIAGKLDHRPVSPERHLRLVE